LLPPLVQAQEATTGEDASQDIDAGAAEAESEALDAEQAARLQELAALRSELEQALEELRSEQGIYSPLLVEAYSDLGALHTQLEDFDSAARVYNDALQIARINTGLYSEQQVPLLESLIDSHQQRQDWQKVDDLVHLHLHLHQRLYARTDSQYLEAAKDYGAWKQRAINQNLLAQGAQGRLNDARDLSQFYERLLLDLETTEASASDTDQTQVLALLDGKTQADLTMARAIANTPYTYFNGNAQRYISQTRCRNVTNAQGQVVRQCYQVQVENPRYRQSQRDAKRFELSRYTREIDRNLEQMQTIQQTDNELTAMERADLEERIATFRAESQQITVSSRNLIRF
jgi:hypothetical protein